MTDVSLFIDGSPAWRQPHEQAADKKEFTHSHGDLAEAAVASAEPLPDGDTEDKTLAEQPVQQVATQSVLEVRLDLPRQVLQSGAYSEEVTPIISAKVLSQEELGRSVERPAAGTVPSCYCGRWPVVVGVARVLAPPLPCIQEQRESRKGFQDLGRAACCL